MATKTTARKPSPRKAQATAEAPTNVFKAESRPGMEFTYETVDAPVQARPNREAQPNPHAAGVVRLVEMYREDEASKGKPRALTIVVPATEAKQHSNWLRKAGTDNDVSVLITATEAEAVGDVAMTRLTFRATKRITRNRSKTAEAIANPTEAASQEETKF